MKFFILVLCLCALTRAATLTIAGTLRDHSPTKHPDFENANIVDRGIVKTELGADGKPVYAHGKKSTKSVRNEDSFNQWYNDVEGVNKKYSISLTLVGNNGNPVIYSYQNNSFFPLDGRGWGNEGRVHNFHFTMESHSKFTYHGGEVFNFIGDDDVWVFINKKLVIDLGGVHSAQSASERHTSASELRIETTLSLECLNYDHCGVCEGDGQSCCTCDDGDPCTIDSCEVTTGACQTAPTCRDNDECTMDLCNAGVCSYEPTFECEGIYGFDPYSVLAIVLYIAAASAIISVAFVGGYKAVEKYRARKVNLVQAAPI